MTKMKTVTVPLSELKQDFYVRQLLNEEHAIMLGCLIEDGVELPPILITPDYQVIDGRHRVSAHDMMGKIEIKAQIIDKKNKNELIVMAYNANTGGALPPTKEDTEHTIRLLLERGVSEKKIKETLEVPSSLGRKWIDNVKSKLNRQKLVAAINAISEDGLTAQEAAEKYKVSLEKIKEALAGKRKKKTKNDDAGALKKELTQRFRSISQQNAALLKKLLQQVEDADIPPKEAKEIIAHLERLQRKSTCNVQEWKKRFESAYEQTE